ncbi:S41 family peptidase [Flavobacterium capsici]|uniref:S41 family peptidase n=1 Tax=Flavobacterium capsici TaxID=3075618 RepID=A0AA96F3E9_9FLAO|nr:MULTISPECIES: S41 family peptidase [unclassified Flavobacterium]WNM18798.1 S41 family peptidase [Flavobacterium sp. PMR2A8]WNM22849.1 S41 family peptidase [Flavobacterium sp. PMTSA4]
MKKNLLYLLIAFLFVSITSCEDADDNPVPSALVVKDFVWKGMNLYYLWQADSPDLADDRFATQTQLNVFLETFETPTDVFNHLRIDNSIDRFSVIFSDYRVLEGVLTGNTKNNGMDFALRYADASETAVIGWVRYIIPNSDASTKDIQRGDIFYAIDGVPLTADNFNSLLANDTYTVNLADYNGTTFVPNGQSVTLTKTDLPENPILVSSVIPQGTHNIGYLMYNGFYSAYDNQLNTAFGSFQSQNVTDLVLDLRYNSGGSVATATKLASMITGQFTNQLFAKQQWNAKVQAYYENNNPGALENKFVGGLNSLNLNKVYVLTTKSTASASELIINCLKPYINVVQIGDVTTGKNVGSVTLYDSPNFTKTDVNPTHKYAMQPITFRIVNKDNFGEYSTGITPNFSLVENLANLGELGNPTEPLLSAAITQIIASGRMPQSPENMQRDFKDAKSINPLRTEMYLDLK